MRFQRIRNHYLAVIAHIVSVGQIVVLVIILVPCGVEVYGYVLGAELLLVFPWFRYVGVFHQSAVLCILHVVGIDVGMHVVTVAPIIAIYDCSELAVLLV